MNGKRSVWLALVWPLIAGAIGGGVLWFILNQIVVNGRSILERAGPPFRTPVLFVLAGAVVAGIAAFLTNRRAQALREALHGVAGELGLRYEEGDVQVPPEARLKVPLFAHWSRCANRLSGKSHGVPAQMFDLTTVPPGEEPQGLWTVVVFEQTDLPAFACFPNVWWTRRDRTRMSSLNFDEAVGDELSRQAVTEFQTAYQVCLRQTAAGSDEDEARRLCAPRMAALARHPGWCIQSADGCLVLARCGIAPAAGRVTLWQEAHDLRRALLAPVSSAVTAIPAGPGMDRGRVQNRQVGKAGGGVAGAMIGFFGSFIIFACVMFGVRGRPSPYFMFAFFPVVIGGLVIGAVMGTWVGKMLADRTYRPAPAARRRPRSRGDGFTPEHSRAGFSRCQSRWVS